MADKKEQDEEYERQIERLMSSVTEKMRGTPINMADLMSGDQLRGLAAASLSMGTMVHCLTSMGLEPGMAAYLVAEYTKALIAQAIKPSQDSPSNQPPESL